MVEPSRIERKREKTRSALINAARKLVLENTERISIQSITNVADVGLGTFYNYFDSKQAIFEAVLEEIRTNFNNQLSELRKPLKDPATIIAVTMRFCLEQAQDNEEWLTFLAYSGLEGDYVLQQDEHQCIEDIRKGAASGRFKVEDVEFTGSLVMGMVRHVSREISSGKLPRKAMQETGRHVLRMLGIPDLVAKALTQAPVVPSRPVAAEKKAFVPQGIPASILHQR